MPIGLRNGIHSIHQVISGNAIRVELWTCGRGLSGPLFILCLAHVVVAQVLVSCILGGGHSLLWLQRYIFEIVKVTGCDSITWGKCYI